MRGSYRLQPDSITARSTVQDVTMLLGAWAVLYGAVTVIGGDPVWMIPAYETALQVPYSPESWGWVILVLGIAVHIAMFTGSRKLMMYSLFGCGVWNLFFMYSFLAEYIDVRVSHVYAPGVGLGPVVTYTLIALLFLSRVNTYRGKNAVQVHTP